MDERLMKAARGGDVNTLKSLMEEDPELLERESLAHSVDSVLHVASRRGKTEFVKDIVNLMPSLVIETNQKGLIPLHMAAAQGHVDTVKELLKVKLVGHKILMIHQCLVQDDDGRTPLHYAVFSGRVGVIQELISHFPACVEEVTAREETVLHLAVKGNQLEALKVIVKKIKWFQHLLKMLKAEDINGNTVYDLASAKKKSQILEVLKELDEKEDDDDEDEISEELLINVEGVKNKSKASNKDDHKEISNNEGQLQEDAILVVATLLITLTYGALASPTSTFFKDGSSTIEWDCLKLIPPLFLIGTKHLECPANLAFWFMLFNSLIFFTSILLVVVTSRLYLVQLLTVYLIYCYCVLLTAFCYNSVYFAIPFGTIVILGFVISKRNEAFGPLIKCFGTLATKCRRKDGYHKVPTSET